MKRQARSSPGQTLSARPGLGKKGLVARRCLRCGTQFLSLSKASVYAGGAAEGSWSRSFEGAPRWRRGSESTSSRTAHLAA